MSDEDCDESDDNVSTDSVDVEAVIDMVLEDDRLLYLCRTSENTEEIYDRSDLMDGARIQSLVTAYERRHPPPWDPVCVHCGGEGCGECVCEECDRECRHINGVNYGCVKHPVI
jgi:hypothetical protein